ncbi:MAG TPA: hypothetical protein VJJ26_01755 [Candidatus Babeliales bacterium]|nr:hypothetical protein [Candidatus Babeliales bacterium]
MKMNINEVIFLINEKEKIVLRSQDPLDEISCCYDALISLVQEKRTILLSDDDIIQNMRIFALLLKEALGHSLLLDSSLDDIGFVYNQFCRFLWSEDELSATDNFFYEDGDKNKDWIGMRYHLWAGGNNVTWLYNDKNGAIILEVTPFYPYLHVDPNEELNYIPYEEWIKDYKPYFTTTISKEMAEQWLAQADSIVKQINDNVERWEKEEKSKEKADASA